MASSDGKSEPATIWGRAKQILSAPRRWSGVTWAAVMLAVFLQLLMFTCWLTFRYDTEHVPWKHYMTWPRWLAMWGMLIVIPVVFHRVLKLLLEGEQARFPEIESAWQAGIEALRENGISLQATPLFLVTGAHAEAQERALMDAYDGALAVTGVPKGPGPLHWYGNNEAVFLFCSETSWLSALNRLRKNVEEERVALQVEAPEALPEWSEPAWEAPQSAAASEQAGATRETASPAAMSPAAMSPAPVSNVRGTMMLDQFVGAGSGGAAGGGERARANSEGMAGNIAATAGDRSGSHRGTIQLDAPLAAARPAAAAPASVGMATMASIAPLANPSLRSSAGQGGAVVVPTREANLRSQQLETLCQLVRNIRQPYCPLNGVLALLPFSTIDATASELEELEKAVKADLHVITRVTQIRTPVTALVVGLENETGFRELVRRVGKEKAASQRFGSRFDVRSEATTENLRSFSSHVCGVFEDWVYTLFRERGALSRPGNPRLYGLLCKVRCILKARLGNLLAHGFGKDERSGGGESGQLFSGCYFAATGRTTERQAFVQGVLGKLIAEQEQIEWTTQALVEEQRYRALFTTGLVVDALLVLSLGALLLL